MRRAEALKAMTSDASSQSAAPSRQRRANDATSAASARTSDPPTYRERWLRRRADFQAAFRSGRRARGRMLQMTARANGLGYHRVGLSVGRRVGGAVRRNLVKRRLREAIRPLLLQHLPATSVRTPEDLEARDVVITALPGAERSSLSDLANEITRLCEKLGVFLGHDACHESVDGQKRP